MKSILHIYERRISNLVGHDKMAIARESKKQL
jgi:hypothetical protein